MTRMRDAATQLLSAASSARDQLAQHNRLLVLELEEARARVRVLQVCNPPRTLHSIPDAVCVQDAVLAGANAPGIKENRFPGQVEAKARAAGGREFAPLSQHQQHQNSFTNSPALLLPQPYPATPAAAAAAHLEKSSAKRVPKLASSDTAAASSSPLSSAAAARRLASPLKASLVMQPAARVASPAEVARVAAAAAVAAEGARAAAAAAVAAEHASRAGLSLTRLHPSADSSREAGQLQQQEANFQSQQHQPSFTAAASVPSPSRTKASPATQAAAAAASAARLLRDLESSGEGSSSMEMARSCSGGEQGAGAVAAGVTSRQQLLLWMQVCC